MKQLECGTIGQHAGMIGRSIWVSSDSYIKTGNASASSILFRSILALPSLSAVAITTLGVLELSESMECSISDSTSVSVVDAAMEDEASSRLSNARDGANADVAPHFESHMMLVSSLVEAMGVSLNISLSYSSKLKQEQSIIIALVSPSEDNENLESPSSPEPTVTEKLSETSPLVMARRIPIPLCHEDSDIDYDPNTRTEDMCDAEYAADTIIDRAIDQPTAPSFNIPRQSFGIPDTVVKRSIQDPHLQLVTSSNDLLFHLEDQGSKRNKEKIGRQQWIHRQRTNGTIDWWCPVRSKTNKCPATVIQKGESFQTGRHQHNHNSNPGAISNLKIVSQLIFCFTIKVKIAAITNVFSSSLDIVLQAQSLRHLLAVDLTFIICKESPTDSAKKTRPAEPQDLDFEVKLLYLLHKNKPIIHIRFINYDYLPDNFVRKDVRVGSKRHIILATDQQLELLSFSKIWYMDGTLEIVRKPFVQLFSIHVFLKSGDDTKQVPAAFCIMSSRTKKDYKKDFEEAFKIVTQIANSKRLERSESFNNSFHQQQLRVVLFIGAKPYGDMCRVQYKQYNSVYKFIRKLKSLCYLPKEQIQTAFICLANRVDKENAPKIHELVTYIERTLDEQPGLANSIMTQHRPKSRKWKYGGIYHYPLAVSKASLIHINITLVSEVKLKKIQRKLARSIQKTLFKHWGRYIQGEISVTCLLRLCGRLVYVANN
ncbi:hypothetical protein KUTeg_022078 [Tegillarca granosa]|uniref:Uncharacterized protein n=1 Tax=Tegillarca granosa TaxID=220873 RepID=A0ABQ9E573_TEGGR|nr:hypothetical protein KUTeg_022078 [Tegillarca granosa]